ncbi:unnamed protein product [Lactuca virosa]|uniref:Uncharacterized protein n=1 Tax=Lactuca virosa TaxID=75947 RepID=A0AAU9MXN1_9ASTR|nr:unnamed protein product [Lactuca virosa]
MIDDRFSILRAELEASRPWSREVTFMEFDVCGAPQFMGNRQHIVSRCWIIDVESAFLASFYSTEAKFRFAACLLHNRDADLQRKVVQGLRLGVVESMT